MRAFCRISRTRRGQQPQYGAAGQPPMRIMLDTTQLDPDFAFAAALAYIATRDT
jgi:hypothetical protein